MKKTTTSEHCSGTYNKKTKQNPTLQNKTKTYKAKHVNSQYKTS